MDKYYAIETGQYGIDLAKPIWNICHPQDDEKKYVMSTVETNKQVYLFYQEPYQSNADYLEAFRAHIKVRKSQNVAAEHH